MKALSLLFVIIINTLALQAQVKDSIDNILFKVPPAWSINRQQTYTELTLKTSSGFCQVAIYQQQPSLGNLQASFNKEWTELLMAFFDAPATPSPQAKKIKNANVLYYGAQVKNRSNQLPYYSELYVFDCGSNVQSVIVNYGAKKHAQLFDSSWQSLITSVKKSSSGSSSTASSNNQSSATPVNISFAGKWAKSASSPWGVDPGTVMTYAGYTKCQYDFKPDGTYTMHGESYANAQKWTLLNENGTFKVNGQQIIITPAKSGLQVVNGEGKVLQTKAVDMSKRTYTWQMHYFEGLQDNQLVLTPVKEYFQDGGFGGNSAFPNSYLYSQQYKPEWRFNVK
jgi:hypothetical protein